jgi:HD-like signal output (HDOD) protein
MKNTIVPNLDLEKILPLAQLPGLPQSAVQLLKLSADPANGPAEFAVPIEVDVGLTGQILRLVNSSYFGFAQKISNIKMAIYMVGIRTIKNFTLWSAVFSLTVNPTCSPFDLRCLWQDSLRRALFARTFAKLLGMKDSEDVFAAALLQDMAIPILAKASPEFYVKLFGSRKQGKIRLSALENEAFGWTHAQAAGMMARHWKLPEALANMIENHISIEEYADLAGEAPDKAAVAMSALLPTVADPDWTECQQFESYYDKIIPGNKPMISELMVRIDKGFGQLAPAMKIPAPAKTLVHRYNEATITVA